MLHSFCIAVTAAKIEQHRALTGSTLPESRETCSYRLHLQICRTQKLVLQDKLNFLIAASEVMRSCKSSRRSSKAAFLRHSSEVGLRTCLSKGVMRRSVSPCAHLVLRQRQRKGKVGRAGDVGDDELLGTDFSSVQKGFVCCYVSTPLQITGGLGTTRGSESSRRTCSGSSSSGKDRFMGPKS